MEQMSGILQLIKIASISITVILLIGGVSIYVFWRRSQLNGES